MDVNPEFIYIPEEKLPFLHLGKWIYYKNKETGKEGSSILKKIDIEKRVFLFGTNKFPRPWNRKWDEYDFYIKDTDRYQYDCIFNQHNPEYKTIKPQKRSNISKEIKQKCKNLEFLKNISGVYVLRLENDYFYVGEGVNIYKRITAHIKQCGAKLTTMLKIQSLSHWEEENDYKKRLILENQITKELIQKYGADKVRGGKYC